MSTLKILTEQLNTIESIKLITQTLGDISAMELKATRKSKEHNIAYFQEISQVYKIVKSISVRLEQTNPGSKTNKIAKPQLGTVAVLLTANSHFYGGLDTELTQFYVEGTQKLDCDRIVVGLTGDQILTGIQFPQPYKRIVFEKDDPSLQELKSLADLCFKYSKVLVFHTKFITVLNQQPALTDLSIPNVSDAGHNQLPFYYITEPEIDKMIEFFDSQISFLMFQAIFIEVNYARLAARMISMNQAEDNANKSMQKQKRLIIDAKRQKLNLEILENFFGVLSKHRQESL